jgi:hypothetical protein
MVRAFIESRNLRTPKLLPLIVFDGKKINKRRRSSSAAMLPELRQVAPLPFFCSSRNETSTPRSRSAWPQTRIAMEVAQPSVFTGIGAAADLPSLLSFIAFGRARL